MLCLSADLCLGKMSVRLSVTRRYCVETAKRILKLVFTVCQLHHSNFSYQTVWKYSDGDPLPPTQNAEGMKKSRFSTNILLYLGNDSRSHTICELTLSIRNEYEIQT